MLNSSAVLCYGTDSIPLPPDLAPRNPSYSTSEFKFDFMSEIERNQFVRLALGVLAVLVLLYSLLIARRFLFGVSLVAWLFVVYLFWRFVRAVERIASALES